MLVLKVLYKGEGVESIHPQLRQLSSLHLTNAFELCILKLHDILNFYTWKATFVQNTGSEIKQ